MEFLSHNPADTEALGEQFARRARPGWVIALDGDLGAGKTRLVTGLARGLGVTSRVHSPTFTLVNEYQGGRLKLVHLDLYRLETPEQVWSAGIAEFLQTDGVCVMEWAARLEGCGWRLPQLRRVQIEILGEHERRIIYDDFL